MTKPAIFFDRDGIIVKPVGGEAPVKPEDMELIDGILPVILKSRKSGYLIFVVSNQPDIALGLIDEKTKNSLEEKFIRLLKERNIEMDGIYYCHHDKNGTNLAYAINCDCRKPKPGLLKKAAGQFDINLKYSFMIGDRASDIKAGQAYGVKTILYDPLNLQEKFLKKHSVNPDFSINELTEIVELI